MAPFLTEVKNRSMAGESCGPKTEHFRLEVQKLIIC